MINKNLPEGYLPSVLASQAAQRKDMAVKHQHKSAQKPKESRNDQR